MKKLSITLLTIFTTVVVFGQDKIKYHMNIGDTFLDVNTELLATDNKHYSLTSMKKKKGILIVFAANKCIAVAKLKIPNTRHTCQKSSSIEKSLNTKRKYSKDKAILRKL